ncbi:uncharacterized protein LOC133182421 [Saccostrea echinata]|uniref:uncharacterized protein LOC133182421 n=1 Tax=Saccostrea echinata TaxID=191078 RepID=UPI002A800428|nr:uncharacterized protein LOC133182421 [Saccostrea echinata]
MALNVHRNTLWTHNTNNIGHLGLHSETRNLTSTRNTCAKKHFGVLITALNNSEKQNFRIMSGHRRELEQSLLALSQRMREINESRFSPPASRKTSFPQKDSRSVSDASTFSFGSSRSSVSSYNSFSKYIGRRLSPVKGKRKSRNSIDTENNKPENGEKRERRFATISPPDIGELQKMSENSSELAEKSNFSLTDLQERVTLRKSCVRITPFPDLPPDIENTDKEETSSISFDETGSTTTPRRSTRKRSKARKKSSKGSIEEAPIHEQETTRNNPHARMIALQKLQMETQKRAALAEKQRQELIKKNRKEVTESFRYSHAIEQFIKSRRQNSKITMSEVPDEVEYDAEGREIRRLGPSVLSVINFDDIYRMTVRRRRHTTTGLGEKRPSFYRMKSRKSIASVYHPLPDINKESKTNSVENPLSTKKFHPKDNLPPLAENQVVVT